MYKIEKLTVKNRCEIPVNSVVEIEVNEEVYVPIRFEPVEVGKLKSYATVHIRKTFAKQGLLQLVTTPIPEGTWKPLIVVQNNGVSPIELRKDEEIASVWIFEK